MQLGAYSEGAGVTDGRLGAKLAEGACAEIYEWGADGSKVVKVAKPNTNLFALQREHRLCQIAWQLGLPVPRPYDLVETGGRNGIVFERAAGESILQRFAALAMQQGQQLEADRDCLDARATARTLSLIHGHTSDGLPAQRDSLERDIRRSVHLSDAEKDAVMDLLDQLPLKRQLCHGDPNPGNSLLAADKVIVVDWNNATEGNPEADLAEYVLMLRYATLPHGTTPEVVRLFEAARASSIRQFIEEYQSLTGIGAAEIEPWIAPVAARKLAVDGITDAEKDLLVLEVRRRLSQERNSAPGAVSA